MNKIYKKLLLLIAITGSLGIYAQNVNVTIDLEKQRFLGEESNLDRAKFFNIHTVNEEPSFPTFLKDNNIGTGRRFFGPFSDRSFINPKGNFSAAPVATSDGVIRPVRRFISTSAPASIWSPGFDTEEASNAAVRYFINEVDTDNRPEYWEPFNEPFIKAGSFGLDAAVVRNEMSVWFREMARKIHATPELARMKVIGFSDAFPSFARDGFKNWQERTKLFVDIAGADIDAIAVHPYDGINITGEDTRRSGSNSEAILDIIETYTAQKFGNPKKLAISEFGIIEQNYPFVGPPTRYNESENAITIRGINSMLFNFFERQDNIEICIPFITGRADFFYNTFTQGGVVQVPNKPYVPAFLRPTEVFLNGTNAPFRNDTYELTFKQNFYKFWKDIKGDRAVINSDNLDVQVQAFIDGNTAYIALNNLDDADKSVDLTFLSGSTGVTQVSTRSIVIKGQDTPIYEDGVITSALPTNIDLKDGETKILTVTYSSPVQFASSIKRKKYYGVGSNVPSSLAPTSPITANVSNTFTISNVVKGANGKAVLRIGVGIPLDVNFFDPTPTGLSRLPSEITFNGNALPIPTNWKGYDQEDRPDFFGVFEIEIPDYNDVNNGDNTVTIKYAQTGGRIASVVLSVETEEGLCVKETLYADEDNDGLGDPNISIESCGPVRGFVTNANDPCLNDPDNKCIIIIPGSFNAADFTAKIDNPDGVRSENGGQQIGFIKENDYTEYNITATESGRYEFDFSAATGTNFGGSINVLIDGVNQGSVVVPPTGSAPFDFSVYESFKVSGVSIPSGNSTLRLLFTDRISGDFLFNIRTVNVTLIPSTVDAVDDSTATPSPRGAITPISILANDSNEVGNTPLPAEVNIDLDPAITGDQNSLIVASEGTWDYNVSNGILSFTPNMGFTANPTNISYTLTEIANGESDIANVSIEYVQEPIANDNTSLNNDAGIVSINILADDTSGIDGSVLTPAQVTVDLDPSTPAIDTTLSAGILGNWEYNDTIGALTFTPPANFSGNPPAITYEINETANDLTDTANVTVTYKEFIFAKFKVTNTGVTCVDKKNGSILIESSDTGDFSVNVSGTASSTANFTDQTTISDLDSGNYKLEITDNGSNEVFVFDVSISEPLPLNVSAKVLQSEAQVILTLDGSNQFTINLNGTEFTTTENNLTLQLEDGVNELSVKAEKDCQGKFSQKIVIGNEVMAYPNPVVDYLTVETGFTEEVNISVFSLSGAQVISQNTTSTNGISYINMQGLVAGIYFVKVNTPNSTSTFKIVK